MKSVISEGLIVPDFTSCCNKYQFAHDQIQLATSSLILEDDLSHTNIQIGYKIWKSLNDEQLEENLFLKDIASLENLRRFFISNNTIIGSLLSQISFL